MKYNDFLLIKRQKLNENKLEEGVGDVAKSFLGKIKGLIAFSKCMGQISQYQEVATKADSNYAASAVDIKILALEKKLDAMEKQADKINDPAKAKEFAEKVAAEGEKIDNQITKLKSNVDVIKQAAQDELTNFETEFKEEQDKIVQSNLKAIVAKKVTLVKQAAKMEGLKIKADLASQQDDPEGSKKVQEEIAELNKKVAETESEAKDAEEAGEEEKEEAQALIKDLKAFPEYKAMEKGEENLNKGITAIVQKYGKIIAGFAKASGEESGVSGNTESKDGKGGSGGVSAAVAAIKGAISAAKSYEKKPKETETAKESLLFEGVEEVKKIAAAGVTDLEKLLKLESEVIKAKIGLQKAVEAKGEEAGNTIKAAAGVEYEDKKGNKHEAREISEEPSKTLTDAIAELKELSGKKEESDEESDEKSEVDEKELEAAEEAISAAKTEVDKAKEEKEKSAESEDKNEKIDADIAVIKAEIKWRQAKQKKAKLEGDDELYQAFGDDIGKDMEKIQDLERKKKDSEEEPEDDKSKNENKNTGFMKFEQFLTIKTLKKVVEEEEEEEQPVEEPAKKDTPKKIMKFEDFMGSKK